ncbi:MAG: tRNA pseudouridine(54/55) synthase Pus10 [Planctomycetota bacterium]|nr:tRNA pseudouridine(54/55) synthase Pus10 [Planctomycetota bacterium]
MNQPQNQGGAPRSKIFIEGRYRKLVRDLPQTVFHCPTCKGHPRRRRGCEQCEGFGKLTRDSVQELVAWVIGKAFGTRKNKFHGSGREDMDVRMLGTGRPFVLELLNPKNFGLDLAELETEVNRRNDGRLEVLGLHYSDKPRVVVLKEAKHAKRYEARVSVAPVDPESSPDVESAVAALSSKIDERIDVVQRTPNRVAHRRADLDRERWIQIEEVEALDGEHLRLRMLTEHGTYVKEAISGEDGRTEPSMSGIAGAGLQCVELDVLGILGETGEDEVEPAVFESPFGSGLE